MMIMNMTNVFHAVGGLPAMEKSYLSQIERDQMADNTESGVPAVLRSTMHGAGTRVLGLGIGRVLSFITTFLLTHNLAASLCDTSSFGEISCFEHSENRKTDRRDSIRNFDLLSDTYLTQCAWSTMRVSGCKSDTIYAHRKIGMT